MKTAIISAALLAAGAQADATDLREHLWQSRPILVFAEADDPRLAEQITLFHRQEVDLTERRNVVIVDTEPGSDLRRLYAPEGFTVILVGLDGGEKFRSGEVTDPGTLSALIDTMPMRQNALRRESND